MIKATLATLAVAAFATTAGAQSLSLNEFVLNDSSTDDHEFVEICGPAGFDLTGYSIVLIEGEGSSTGLIDRNFALTGTIGASGFYTIGDAAVSPDQVKGDTMENGGATILLVQGFSGSLGFDVDTDNDGNADGPFPGQIVDLIGTGRPSQGDAVYYGAQQLGPDTGNGGTSDFDVAGGARCGDCDGTWGFICLSGTEPTGTGCDVNNAFNPYNQEFATPGMGNGCGTVSVEASTWGQAKSSYR